MRAGAGGPATGALVPAISQICAGGPAAVPPLLPSICGAAAAPGTAQGRSATHGKLVMGRVPAHRMAAAVTTKMAVRPVRMPAPDGVEALLRELVAGQRQIIQLLEQQRRPSHPTREDRDRLAAILPAIAGALGSEAFASRDLVSDDAAPALRVVLAGLTVKSIGRLLARAEGTPINGYMVERCGVEINVTLWRVVAC